ncbi:MAG TPA: diaminopimelate decarboxylase [Propionibacteriaceae bacterium]|nr:diaminopimelate decarboxylase [Propionibacteriaceae bacterium]
MSQLLELFPLGSATDADGMLVIGGCRADDLAAEFGTPVLVVAEEALRARAREYADELSSRWPNSRAVFASKAFPCTAVQRVMVDEGLGLDVAGGGEILTALKAGVDPALIVLHGNAKTTEEITMAVDNGIGLVVVDGPDDVDRLEAIVPPGRTQDVLVRVIPGVTADTHAHVLTGHEGSKFGLAPAAAAELVRRMEHSPRLRMRGVHAHVGSQILQAEPLAAAVAPLAALGEFEIYDLGGGLGARYTWADKPVSVAEYLDVLISAAREHLPRDAQIIIEPGRSMVATAAATIYRVITIKRGQITFVAVDGGMGDNLEVALFDQRFEAGIADRLDATDGEIVSVVGRHCESGDILVDGVPLNRPHVNDLLVVPATGAYCFTMSNNYNGNRRIPVVFVASGMPSLVVRRETWDDLAARDVS